MLEQHIAAQGIANRIQRRERALGLQVSDGFGQVFTGAGMVAARQQIRLAGATAPVQRNAGPPLITEDLLQAGDIGRVRRAGQPVQHQHQGCVGGVRPVPVEIKEVAIIEPKPFARAVDMCGFTPQRAPQGLQVRVAKANGRGEAFARREHDVSLKSKTVGARAEKA